MTRCPSCGQSVPDAAYFCGFCGASLKNSGTGELEKIVYARLDAIRTKDEAKLRSLFEQSIYTKFDDWPPFTRQEAAQALMNEERAYKVLTSYEYEVRGLRIDLVGQTAIATFHIRYSGSMRGRAFTVMSRVTIVLAKKEQSWKVVHEHWSRFPEERSRTGMLQ
ncbi:MAG: nuclear transport factor 2 family protein [Candidatus Bathyarchaeia archaeon]